MMPVYMDASQPCQMRPQGYYHQGYGNSPHHMTMDAPTQCYGNFPAYNAYWPPCYPPQVPYYPHCMNHSGFHPHASYAPPCYIQPPFPVGYQPWYDSEKDMSGKHNSPQICNSKNDRGVVIEEHEPEIEKGNQGEAVLPVRSTNYPYPIVWIPHGNAQNQDRGSSVGSEIHEQSPAEVKAPENMAVQKSVPKSWNGCFPFDESTIKSLAQNQDCKKAQNGKTIELPFDISKLKSLLQGQDGKEAQIQKNKEEPGQLPYPVVWIPSHGKREDVEASDNKKSSDKGHNLKSSPTDQGRKIQNEGKEGNIECKVLADAEEKTSIRNIPVESNPQGPRNILVKLLENHMPKPTEPTKEVAKNLPVENIRKERSSSSPKASRLPPVCLRVDPSPKKKSGGSRSLSPPIRKEEPLSKLSSLRHSMEAERKFVPEACNVKCEEIGKDMKMSEGRLSATGTEVSNSEIARPCETKERGEKPGKKTFTEEEAARNIQSRYRGYDVRRREPLKKLKEIATVREQMSDIKKRIQMLEVSTDQHIEEKEVVVLTEMVMNLLLKLDSVQGLHPSIRDYRKSLARELSDIQDKLDSLGNSKAIAEKEAVKENVEITSQTSGSPVNLEHSQLADANKIVFDSDAERVFHPSIKEHPLSLVTVIDEQPAAEAEEGTGLSETLATDLEPVTDKGIYEAVLTSTTAPEKITSQISDCPVNLEHSQFTEEKQMVSDSNTENLLLSSEKHPMSVLNTTDGQPAAEAEDGSGLFGILVSQPEPATETSIPDAVATLTSVPEKIGEIETVLPINAPSADENGMRVINREEEKGVVRSLEKPPHKFVQVVETTCGQDLNACEAKANAPDNEDRKEDNATILPAEKDIELSELPVGVSDEETQLLSRDSSACASEGEMTGMDPEKRSQERIDADHSSDSTQGIGQETCNLTLEEKEESPETQVIVKEQPQESEVIEHETRKESNKLVEENQRFKEMMEALVKAGREQLEVISKLTGRVKSLEKKLSHKKRIKRRKSCRTTDAVL
ncbi:BAG family molecular chaperone regulator 6 [Cardamine amara subsp. amara]|uniref:BAG family molecular chaperone regulator 6 n=1 Tax=Cardamine amara subsp. amara TaxID=228776 RepID=A0ABD0ZT64_CARAN